MPLRPIVALQITGLLMWGPAPGRPVALGFVVEAERAHVNATTVTAGTTIYDGDRYSTEAKGTLLLRAGTSILELGKASVVHLRNTGDGAQRIEAHLDRGTLLFGVARQAELEVVVCGSRVRPSGDGRTGGQISFIGPKELRIYAQRGKLEFSYRGETDHCAGRVLSRDPGSPGR